MNLPYKEAQHVSTTKVEPYITRPMIIMNYERFKPGSMWKMDTSLLNDRFIEAVN